MANRDLTKEQEAVNLFIQNQGKKPISSEDWKQIHTMAYGSDLPAELNSLPMYSTPTVENTVPITNAKALNYMGSDISDTALSQAKTEASSYNTSNFLDKVKTRLQEKFKPESETLGLGTFASGLGALDPTGVNLGMQEQSNKFIRNGNLALKALSTANDIYSEQATLAINNLNYLTGLRSDYDTKQKETENELKNLALSIAEQGQNVPQEILDLLPKDQQAVFAGLGKIYKNAIEEERSYAESLTENKNNSVIGNKIYNDQPDNIINSTAKNIADAIKQVESNGNYKASGGSGEYGAYQFMPATWESWKNQYLKEVYGTSNMSFGMTPENQDAIAIWKINKLLKQGYTPEEIALIWNHGSAERVKGINSYGVAYDSGAYADKVIGALSQIMPKEVESVIKFTQTEQNKLAQANLINAPLQEQLDYLYGKKTNTSKSLTDDWES